MKNKKNKNNKKNRILALLLVATLLLCAGCKGSTKKEETGNQAKNEAQKTEGNSENKEGGEESRGISIPLEGEKQELSMWLAWSNSYVESLNDVLSVQEMERKTNVHVNYNAVASAEASEKFGLLLASGDLPDIIYMNGVSYPGGLEKAVEEGILRDLTDDMDLFPNYDTLRHSNEDALKETLTDQGRSVVVYSLNGNDTELALEDAWAGMSLRRDWLEEQGYEIPETIDEWHDVLKIFKEVYQCEAPLALGKNGSYTFGYFAAAYGILPGFYQVDDVVHYGPMEEGYRSYVELMRDWYAEGLIDTNFVTNDASMMVPFQDYGAGKFGAGPIAWGFTADILKTSFGLNDDENFYIMGVPAPVQNKGDQSKCGFNGSNYAAYPFGITTSCKNLELAAAWLDFQFTTEAMEINNYGIEGETWEQREDGGYTYTEYISADPKYSFVDKLFMSTWGNVNFGRYTWEKYDTVYDLELRKCQKEWSKEDNSLALPNVSMTDEEGVEYNSLYTAISTLVEEKTVKYIMGTESMDTYEDFQKDIQSYGVERCLEIYQAALDRYNNR